ncbi:DUF1538 family protein [Entomospira entomophila]|uniref:DUF1538 family protein n=1 Tax=Entomospira entomophila TaxID=2719988 RepID=A0A968G8N0_9SPIO|nr:DUF1538 domain-containing protein [Entomospira entomophilus]NIZ40593.1 DUF1538 family protein [Entomospira entomophilus]WDI34808.1 DUF1538 family protein [Entomospira entomophilus]
MKAKANRIYITPRQSLALVHGYGKKKISEQLRAISFITIYLIIFQLIVLNIPLSDPVSIFIGLSAVVLGLAFFLEGLFLSVMPLAEMAGAELPSKMPLAITLILAFFLGILATLAEPAMVVLQEVANSIPMHQAPLLYYIFNYKSLILVMALGLGVGIAILLGSLLTLRNFSLKTFIISLLILALALSIIAYLDERSRPMVALAWDAGGIATGAVTVPLIIAFGLGLNRTTENDSESNGLGIVTLANLGPVNSVLLLSIIMRSFVPHPANDLESFLANPEAFSFIETLDALQVETTLNGGKDVSFFLEQMKAAITAVGPLVLALALIIMIFIRKRPNFIDEKILGVIFTIIGMFFLNYGIQTGLTVLGRDVGSNIYSIIAEDEPSTSTIHNFDVDTLEYILRPNGESTPFFKISISGRVQHIPFEVENYDAESQTYHLGSTTTRLEREFNQPWSKMLLFLGFFILLGFGGVIAEPTLHTLANTLSELTAGSFPKAQLIQQVALGVGIGLAIGVIRMMWDIPFLFLLLPLYIFALVLTIFSESTYMAVAWDAAGVATGPITVPLVMTVGIGLNQHLPSQEQFGFLTLGATIPILILLTVSLKAKIQQKRLQQAGDAK